MKTILLVLSHIAFVSLSAQSFKINPKDFIGCWKKAKNQGLAFEKTVVY